MPRNFSQEDYIFRVAQVLQQTFTASSTTNLITSTAHGLSNGDMILVTNSGGALPTPLAASTVYWIISATTNTFQLSLTENGAAVTLTGDGTGTQTYTVIGKPIKVIDWQHKELMAFSANSANLSVSIQVSEQESVNFAAAASSTNRWSYVKLIKISDGSPVDGASSGMIAPAGTDVASKYEINDNGGVWISANFATPGVGYTAGNLNLVVRSYNDFN